MFFWLQNFILGISYIWINNIRWLQVENAVFTVIAAAHIALENCSQCGHKTWSDNHKYYNRLL